MVTPKETHHVKPVNWILRLVAPLFESNVVTIGVTLWQLGRRIVTRKAHEGMYEVLDYESELELMDGA